MADMLLTCADQALMGHAHHHATAILGPALPTAHVSNMLTCGCFQAYWFYRPTEVPESAWSTLKRVKKYTKGCAAYKLPDKNRLAQEDLSERQVRTAPHCPHQQR